MPAALKQMVWIRDGGQCTFVAPSGRRCRGRVFLEFHHRYAYALGGETTPTNVSLHCRAHNAYEAEQVFGPRPPGTHAERAENEGGGLAPGRVRPPQEGDRRAPA